MAKGSYLADLVTIIGTQDLVFVRLIVNLLYYIVFWFVFIRCLKFIKYKNLYLFFYG